MNAPLRSTSGQPLFCSEELRAGLCTVTRARVPWQEVDDVVQSTLADALASESRPEDPIELRKWVYGIARHKAFSCWRAHFAGKALLDPDMRPTPAEQGVESRRGRGEESVEVPEFWLWPEFDPADDDEECPAHEGLLVEPPLSARDLLRWVDRQVPEESQARTTLEWLLRHEAGDSVEAIAAEERVSAVSVRVRMMRLRQRMRERWAAEMAVAEQGREPSGAA